MYMDEEGMTLATFPSPYGEHVILTKGSKEKAVNKILFPSPYGEHLNLTKAQNAYKDTCAFLSIQVTLRVEQ